MVISLRPMCMTQDYMELLGKRPPQEEQQKLRVRALSIVNALSASTKNASMRAGSYPKGRTPTKGSPIPPQYSSYRALAPQKGSLQGQPKTRRYNPAPLEGLCSEPRTPASLVSVRRIQLSHVSTTCSRGNSESLQTS